MLLSIAMIVKNEENNLDRCLNALKVLDNKIRYEIIVVDTGSTDKTISIAKKYTEKIYEHEWSGNFAQMRNISIKYCKGTWILVLDADEVLESEEELIGFLKSRDSKTANCATVKFKNFLSDNNEEYLVGTLVRIFRNTKDFYYRGRVHEQPNILPPTGFTNITLKHYGYSRDDYKLMEYKYERNKKLLLKDLEEGKDLIYTYFQLAQTYSMANKMDKSFISIKKAFNLVKNENNQKRYLYIYHFYAREELIRHNYEKVIEICEKALLYSEEHMDFYYMMLKSYMAINKYKEADEYFDKYLNLHNKIEKGYIIEDISVSNFSFCKKEDVIREKISCNYKEKNFINIHDLYNKLKKDKSKEQYSEVYIYSLIKNKKNKELIEFLKEKKFGDEYIQCITNVLERLRDESVNGDINEEINYLLKLDDKLDAYINRVLLQETDKKYNREIDLNKFYIWKAKYVQELFVCEEESFNILKNLNKDDMSSYINFMSSNYKCLSLLYEYTQKNFMGKDLKSLNLINSIEEILLLNKSIGDQQYKELVDRAFINKINYMREVYNKRIFSEDNLYTLTNRYEKIWIQIRNLIKILNYDKLKYIRELKNVLDYYPEYNRLIKVFLEDAQENNITEEMIKEKERLLNIVENFANENKVIESLEILIELKKMFKFDSKILNYLGVIKYMNNDYDEAVISLALADVLEEDKFDTMYNLACIFDCKGNLETAEYYYKKSYELCEEHEMKIHIQNIINNLK